MLGGSLPWLDVQQIYLGTFNVSVTIDLEKSYPEKDTRVELRVLK